MKQKKNLKQNANYQKKYYDTKARRRLFEEDQLVWLYVAFYSIVLRPKRRVTDVYGLAHLGKVVAREDGYVQPMASVGSTPKRMGPALEDVTSAYLWEVRGCAYMVSSRELQTFLFVVVVL